MTLTDDVDEDVRHSMARNVQMDAYDCQADERRRSAVACRERRYPVPSSTKARYGLRRNPLRLEATC